jgi:hypothetical protein
MCYYYHIFTLKYLNYLLFFYTIIININYHTENIVIFTVNL